MTDTLDIAPGLSLPLDAVTETFGILAKKGAGKSNAAVVMAEEMWKVGVPWVAIDPKGDWWGMRASGDGDEPGLPIVVFGGRHGDVPLEPGSGEGLADFILDHHLTCVLDVSEFSKGEVIKFLVAFAERLYRQAEDEPMHLFLEEAHEYLPQRVMKNEARLVGAWQKIVKQGRFKGLGCTLVSQRSASLNKDVLTQVDTLIVLRTTSPQDRAAVKGWVETHAESADMLDTLPSLEDGEAWVWSPEFMGLLEKIKFRRRETFDSGATPKVGQKTRRTPTTLADVDLDVIKKQMADTIERAKQSDPKHLQRRIKQLEKQLASQEPEVVEKEIEVEVEVPVPYVPDEVAEALQSVSRMARTSAQSMEETVAKALFEIGKTKDAADRVNPQTDPGYQKAQRRAEVATQKKTERIDRQKRAAAKAKAERPQPVPDDDLSLSAGARRMLEVLGGHRDLVITRAMLGTLARLKSTSGTFSNYLSILKTNGLIEVDGNHVSITEAGLDHLGEDPPIPTTTEELISQWREVLSGGAKRMLDVLVEAHPGALTRQELAEDADLTPSSGTFSNYLSMLRTNGLAEVDGQEVWASDTLFISG